ncbi:MAG: hypothetical protein HY080_09720 [Gammaproteobacteria bacterium]|nr:hypothetical protein [Gammaproteobacteria bacterium]
MPDSGLHLKIQRLQRRCGCVSGSVVALLSLAVTVYYLYQHAASLSVLGLILWSLASIVLALLLGMIAKVISLAITRQQLKRLLYLLQQTFNKNQP